VHSAVGGGVVLALSLTVDDDIFEGLLKSVVHEGFSFLLRQERCLRRVVDGSGGLRACSLGGHRGMFLVAPTVGAKSWNLPPGIVESNMQEVGVA
jgi:hypothetical protein